MDYILRDIDIELWNKVKAKATLERKTMREVIFEGFKWYVTSAEIRRESWFREVASGVSGSSC